MKKTTWLAITAGLLLCGNVPAQLTVDSAFPEYQPVQGVSGSIKSVGSDTLNNLMTMWAEGFKKMYPNATVEIEGKGSSTAPPALIAGTANFGPMSREMKQNESDQFEAKFGYKPISIPTSIDCLAVYVHKDNPIQSLTLQQVDSIFSKTRYRGLAVDFTTWGKLGLTGDWASLPISLYGRNAASGTYGYFKEIALAKGDYRDSVKEQPGSSAVVQGVATDKGGVGYSGIGYKTADVRAVPLSEKPGEKAIEPSAETAYSGEYPLSRYLFIYINLKPGSELDPLRREFIKYILSKQGQMDVIKDGFFPLTPDLARQALKSVGIEPGF